MHRVLYLVILEFNENSIVQFLFPQHPHATSESSTHLKRTQSTLQHNIYGEDMWKFIVTAWEYENAVQRKVVQQKTTSKGDVNLFKKHRNYLETVIFRSPARLTDVALVFHSLHSFRLLYARDVLFYRPTVLDDPLYSQFSTFHNFQCTQIVSKMKNISKIFKEMINNMMKQINDEQQAATQNTDLTQDDSRKESSEAKQSSEVDTQSMIDDKSISAESLHSTPEPSSPPDNRNLLSFSSTPPLIIPLTRTFKESLYSLHQLFHIMKSIPPTIRENATRRLLEEGLLDVISHAMQQYPLTHQHDEKTLDSKLPFPQTLAAAHAPQSTLWLWLLLVDILSIVQSHHTTCIREHILYQYELKQQTSRRITQQNQAALNWQFSESLLGYMFSPLFSPHSHAGLTHQLSALIRLTLDPDHFGESSEDNDFYQSLLATPGLSNLIALGGLGTGAVNHLKLKKEDVSLTRWKGAPTRGRGKDKNNIDPLLQLVYHADGGMLNIVSLLRTYADTLTLQTPAAQLQSLIPCFDFLCFCVLRHSTTFQHWCVQHQVMQLLLRICINLTGLEVTQWQHQATQTPPTQPSQPPSNQTEQSAENDAKSESTPSSSTPSSEPASTPTEPSANPSSSTSSLTSSNDEKTDEQTSSQSQQTYVTPIPPLSSYLTSYKPHRSSTPIVCAALRFFRICMGVSSDTDTAYFDEIRKIQFFRLVVALFVSTGSRTNLLHSSCLELISFLYQNADTCYPLLQSFMTDPYCYASVQHITHIATFKLMRVEYEKYEKYLKDPPYKTRKHLKSLKRKRAASGMDSQRSRRPKMLGNKYDGIEIEDDDFDMESGFDETIDENEGWDDYRLWNFMSKSGMAESEDSDELHEVDDASPQSDRQRWEAQRIMEAREEDEYFDQSNNVTNFHEQKNDDAMNTERKGNDNDINSSDCSNIKSATSSLESEAEAEKRFEEFERNRQLKRDEQEAEQKKNSFILRRPLMNSKPHNLFKFSPVLNAAPNVKLASNALDAINNSNASAAATTTASVDPAANNNGNGGSSGNNHEQFQRFKQHIDTLLAPYMDEENNEQA